MNQMQLEWTTSEFESAGASRSDAPARSFSDDSVRCRIEKVPYFHEESGQCVLEVSSDRFERRLRISGRAPFAYPGQSLAVSFFEPERISFAGADPLPASRLDVGPPDSAKGLRKFLRSGAMTDIGPKLASVLTEAFPENLFPVLETGGRDLLDVPGIGPKRRRQILDSWNEFKERSRLKSFLFHEGLPLNWADTLWAAHGADSLEFLKRRPFDAVSDLRLSFDLLDTFALRHGHGLDSFERIRAGFHDILHNHYKEGHCAYPENLLLEEVASRLEISIETLEEVVENEMVRDRIISAPIDGVPCLYLKEVWDLERNVAEKLRTFAQKETPWGWINFHKVLTWAQNLLDIRLAPLQVEAIETALSSPLTVITGGPGTGKTTLIRSLVTILQTQFCKFALCSPTGRAAQRLGEATGAPAQTIHRMLKVSAQTGKFAYNRERRLDYDLVLIDEASMVDLALMSALLDALPDHAALILVGDADQIPSVGAGTILQSIIASGMFNVVRLTDIFRQSERSQIKANARRINAGEMPLVPAGPTDFHYIPVHGPDQARRVVFDLFTRVIPEDCGIRDPGQSQILVPMNRGSLGTQQLNDELQARIGPAGAAPTGLAGYGTSFRLGDKVMVIKNDYAREVFNGDIGFIRAIDADGQFLEIDFDERCLRFEFDELDRLSLAYAITIHKSQGSEYRAVIVVITREHLPMVQRHLIYTAVTRGKEHVYLVADPLALQEALKADDRRYQKLTALLKEA